MSDIDQLDSDKHKPTTIIVNGREKQWDAKTITFEQVVVLAFGAYEHNENIVYTVTYSRGEGQHEGSMIVGDEVKVKKNMIFNVFRADKS